MDALIINGPMGVGKTTVGKLIADRVPGTAFIDGDWCMDLHPFVGNRETRAMAVDNILHMADNYRKSSLCKIIVIVWLIDDDKVENELVSGLSDLGLNVENITLICNEEQLRRQWEEDNNCEWRTDEWLSVSLRSLSVFEKKDNCIETNGLTVEEVAEKIMARIER